MLKQFNKYPTTKLAIAVLASTLLSAVLLLSYPQICGFIIFMSIIFVAFILRSDPIDFSMIIVPVSFILGGFVVVVPGVILNAIIMRKLPRFFKIISIIFYVLLLVGITIFVSESIIYQLNHLSLKV